MLASPGDVSNERQAARNAINEWNIQYAEEYKIVLLPIGWETHSSPEMGELPQPIINRQFADKCDIVIGIFGARVGTPTDDAISGTVEEIDRGIKASVLTKVYFSKGKVSRENINLDQLKQLEDVRLKYMKQGLIGDFTSASVFAQKLKEHLRISVRDKFLNIDTKSNQNYEKQDNLVQLSKEGASLLIAAASSRGIIHSVHVSAGFYIQVDHKHFIEDQSPRTVARWKAVITELEQAGFIVSTDPKKQVFTVADKGYLFIDSIK